MSKNELTYQHKDVMKALVTALMYGEDAGLAAMIAHATGTPQTIYPCANTAVHISREASYLLAEAECTVIDMREEGVGIGTDCIHQVYLNSDDEAAEIDMSEVTPGNTEQVYTDQPIPKREA